MNEDIARLIKWAQEQPIKPKKKTKTQAPKISCAYFITDGTYVKIGATRDLASRLKDLQTGNPRELKVLYTIPTDTPFAIETQLHEVYLEKQVSKEWYDILDEFPVQNPKYITLKDFEQMFNLDHTTARKLIQTSGFPVLRIGRSLRICISSLCEYLHMNIVTCNGERLFLDNRPKTLRNLPD